MGGFRSHPRKKTPLRMGFRKEAARLEMWYVSKGTSLRDRGFLLASAKRALGINVLILWMDEIQFAPLFETMVETIVCWYL